jgi:hypothetical protein
MNEVTAITEALADTRVPIDGNDLSNSTRNGLLCAFVVAACVLITYPVANMPFSDDFSYDKTALEFTRTGHILYNGWATAMLGWLIPWGALVIKVFGFSFTVMRLAMLPIVVATVFLFHQILRRFGINSQTAVFGTLALALSPIFLPSAASFMTDIPGLLVIFICIYMCQRAVATPSDKAALLWLCSATAINVAGGTVRQIAWLGALAIVPSTAWLLRERRGMKVAGILLWVFSLICVLVCLNWFNKQPYSVPEHIIWAPVYPMTLVHLVAQLVKTLLCFFLVILPISMAWLPTAHRLNRNAWLRFAGVVALSITLAILACAKGRIDTWVMPWLMYLLSEQSSLMPGMFGSPVAMVLWIRLAISLLVIASALILLEHLVSLKRNQPPGSDRQSTSWNELAWILGPFSFSYILLLMPRGAFDQIQDRYLVGLVPAAIVLLLRLYQERVRVKLPVVSLVTLAVFAVYSVAGTHDFFAESRAEVSALHMVESSGVPRRTIQTGFPDDGWVQIENGGHINESRIRVPAGAYNPTLDSKIPEGCRNGFTKFAPAIDPQYFIFFPWFKIPLDPPPEWCFAQANYPPIHYMTWLPPFHATLYVQQLRNSSN